MCLPHRHRLERRQGTLSRAQTLPWRPGASKRPLCLSHREGLELSRQPLPTLPQRLGGALRPLRLSQRLPVAPGQMALCRLQVLGEPDSCQRSMRVPLQHRLESAPASMHPVHSGSDSGEWSLCLPSGHQVEPTLQAVQPDGALHRRSSPRSRPLRLPQGQDRKSTRLNSSHYS